MSCLLLKYWFRCILIDFGNFHPWAQGRIRFLSKVINVLMKHEKSLWVDRIKIKIKHCKINLIKLIYESIFIFFNLFFFIMNYYIMYNWLWKFIAPAILIFLQWFFFNLTELWVVDFSEKIWPTLVKNSLRTDFLK